VNPLSGFVPYDSIVTLTDRTLRHLRDVADLPDLTGTRYEMVAPVGRGGMGAVYVVQDLALGRAVAMKVQSGAIDESSTTRLEAEARVLASLEHPGIVPVHDVGVLPDGRVFYVMKLVQGDRLDRLASTVGTLAERVRLIVRAVDAVAFSHAHGIVHRDLTPGNIMVGAFGEVLVLDWGLAVTVGGNASSQSVAGTPGFMAPEQSHGVADTRSDVYALGALLDWWVAPAQGGPVRLPRTLRAVIDKARSPRPDDRYADAAELSVDLLRYLDGAPVTAYRETWLDRTVRFGRRYRIAILLVLGYLIMRVALLLLRGI